MKILLTAKINYFPALGGANKGNRRVLEGLAQRGHTVEFVGPALGTPSRITYEEFLRALTERGMPPVPTTFGHRFSMNGVDVHAVQDPSQLQRYLRERLTERKPDCVIVTSEDPTQSLLDEATRAMPDRVVYIAHTASFLPFGPQSFFPGARRARLLSNARKIYAVSSFLAEYIERWGDGLRAERLYLPIFDRAPFPLLGSYENPYVTFFNPCVIKGLPIFSALARRHPDVRFAAVPLWGTTKADLDVLATLPNVTLLDPVEDVTKILAQTRVLLQPSLWEETFGMACVEAMLHGIPVLASDLGGLREAKQGTRGLLPVRPIQGYSAKLDENLLPLARCPDQDVEPWSNMLSELLASPESYARASAEAVAGGARYYESATDEHLEEALARAIA